MAEEDDLLAWFDREGYDVHLSQSGGLWVASALLRSQRIDAATTEVRESRAGALAQLQARLKSASARSRTPDDAPPT
jgi:hypothetical protein